MTPFKTIWPDFYIVYLLLSMCTQSTLFNTIWFGLCIVYMIDSFQDHLTKFYQCVPNWILSKPYDLIFTLCTCFYQCVPNWLFSTPYDLIFALCTQSTPLKTIWPDFYILYQIDSFQDHITWFLYCMTWFLDCVHNWLISRPFDLILSMCTQLTPFKTIWMEFYIVYPIYPNDSFQDHLTWFLHSIPNWLLSRPYDLIFVLCTQLTPFKTIWPNFIIV